MSSEKQVIGGAEFTEVEVHRLAELIRSHDFVLLDRLVEGLKTSALVAGMTSDISNDAVRESRGAYQQLGNLQYIVHEDVPKRSDDLRQQAAERAKAHA